MVTGRNSVSELSLKSYSHFLFLLPYDIIPTVVLSSCSLPLYIILVSRDFVILSGKLMSVLHRKEDINISQDLSKEKKKYAVFQQSLDFFANNTSITAGSKQSAIKQQNCTTQWSHCFFSIKIIIFKFNIISYAIHVQCPQSM